MATRVDKALDLVFNVQDVISVTNCILSLQFCVTGRHCLVCVDDIVTYVEQAWASGTRWEERC